MSCAIQNNSGPKYKALKPLITDFYPYAKEKMGFDRDASIFLRSDPVNAKDPLGKTAYYSPSEFKIVVFTDNRHPKDILRSISHELVHHAQNCRGDFKEMGEIGEGYAQNNPHLRKMEEEAYRLGSGIYFRDWTDHLKEGDRIMKEWKETKNRGFGEEKPAKDELNKKRDVYMEKTTVLKENKSKTAKKPLKIAGNEPKQPQNLPKPKKKEPVQAENTPKIEEKTLDQAFSQRYSRLNKALIQRWIRK